MHRRKKWFCHCIIIALLVSKCYTVKNLTCKRFLLGFWGGWRLSTREFTLRQKMAKSKKHKFQLGGVILGQKWQTSSQLQRHAIKIYLQYELRHKMNAQTEKKYSEKNASYHNYILSKILSQELKLIASRAGTPTCFCCDGVGAWNCVFLKWICLHWYSVSEVAVVWAEKGKGNIFSAS